MNIECRRNVFCLFYKFDRAKRYYPSTFDIRYSAVLRFCGSLFSTFAVLRSIDHVFSVIRGSTFLFKFLTINTVGLIDAPADGFDNAAHALIVLKDP